MGQEEKLGVLELGWTFKGVVAMGPDFYIPVFLSLHENFPRNLLPWGVIVDEVAGFSLGNF